MTRMTTLLERNEQFARTYTPVALGLPAAQVIVVTFLDHRVDPGLFSSQTPRPASPGLLDLRRDGPHARSATVLKSAATSVKSSTTM